MKTILVLENNDGEFGFGENSDEEIDPILWMKSKKLFYNLWIITKQIDYLNYYKQENTDNIWKQISF